MCLTFSCVKVNSCLDDFYCGSLTLASLLGLVSVKIRHVNIDCILDIRHMINECRTT